MELPNLYFPVRDTEGITITVSKKEQASTNYIQHLNKHDIATVTYVTKETSIHLDNDTIHDIVYMLYLITARVLSQRFTIPTTLTNGEFGRLINILEKSVFEVWYTSSTQTLLYNWNDTIYLEIVPTCPPSNPFENDLDNKQYRRLIRNYHPHIFQELSQKTIMLWRDKSYTLLTHLVNNDEIPSWQEITQASNPEFDKEEI